MKKMNRFLKIVLVLMIILNVLIMPLSYVCAEPITGAVIAGLIILSTSIIIDQYSSYEVQDVCSVTYNTWCGNQRITVNATGLKTRCYYAFAAGTCRETTCEISEFAFPPFESE